MSNKQTKATLRASLAAIQPVKPRARHEKLAAILEQGAHNGEDMITLLFLVHC